MINAAISAKKKASSGHGGGVRGDNSAPRSVLFEGRFGRMFRALPAGEWPRESLLLLGQAMTAEPEHDENDPTIPVAAFEDPNERIQDDEENAGIAAGYTYLGQFIDHDITFDPASSLMKQNDPDALVDFRTPRLDLDSSVRTRSRRHPVHVRRQEIPAGPRPCSTMRSRARLWTCHASTIRSIPAPSAR